MFKLTFLLPLVVLSSALVIPINKVAPALKEESNVLDHLVDEVENCDSDGGVVEPECCDSDGAVVEDESDCDDSDGDLVDLDLGVNLSSLHGLLGNILCLVSGLLGSILKKGHPIDPTTMLARNSGSGGELVDLDLGVDVNGLNGLLSHILCLLTGLLGSILKKGQPIDPAMMLARNGGSGGELVDLDLGVDVNGLNGLLSHILCLLTGLLGSILKKGQPIDPAMMLARSDGSGGKLLVDLDLELDLNGVHISLLTNILHLLSGLLGSILKKGYPMDPMLARNGGSGGSLIDVDLRCLLEEIVDNISIAITFLGNLFKTHLINQEILVRGGFLGGSRSADTRSDLGGEVPVVDVDLLVNLEVLLSSAIACGENDLLNVNLEAILDDILSILVCIKLKGLPLSLAAAELGSKIIDGFAERNEAKANGVPQSADNFLRGYNVKNEAEADAVVRLNKN